MIDPRICNIAADTNALHRNGSDRDRLVDRFEALVETGTLTLVTAMGVREEAQHPNTPPEEREAVLSGIFNLRPGLNESQRRDRERVRDIMRGDALSDKHDADASHLSEAMETGCCYFITEDRRFFQKEEKLRCVLQPALKIMTLAMFLATLDRYEKERPHRRRPGYEP